MVDACYDVGKSMPGRYYYCPSGVHRDLAIADNTFLDIDNGGVAVMSTDGADISNNTFENVALMPAKSSRVPPGVEDAIAVTLSSDVSVRNNTQTVGNYLRFAYDPFMPAAPAGGYNVQPFLVGFSNPAPHQIQYASSWNVQDALPAGQTPFARLCDDSGNSVAELKEGTLPPPDQWPNGNRMVSAPVIQDLTDVPDGTYAVRMGLAQDDARLKLVGEDDGAAQIVVGTLTLGGSGASIVFQGRQYDVKPAFAHFLQTSPRTFVFSLEWDVHQPLPSGLTPFIHLTDGQGNVVANEEMGLTADSQTWTPGSRVIGPEQKITLPAALPDGVYAIRAGLSQPANPTQAARVTGHADSQAGTIIGRLTVGDRRFRADLGRSRHDFKCHPQRQYRLLIIGNLLPASGLISKK